MVEIVCEFDDPVLILKQTLNLRSLTISSYDYNESMATSNNFFIASFKYIQAQV
jgi:hypothetical protein